MKQTEFRAQSGDYSIYAWIDRSLDDPLWSIEMPNHWPPGCANDPPLEILESELRALRGFLNKAAKAGLL